MGQGQERASDAQVAACLSRVACHRGPASARTWGPLLSSGRFSGGSGREQGRVTESGLGAPAPDGAGGGGRDRGATEGPVCPASGPRTQERRPCRSSLSPAPQEGKGPHPCLGPAFLSARVLVGLPSTYKGLRAEAGNRSQTRPQAGGGGSCPEATCLPSPAPSPRREPSRGSAVADHRFVVAGPPAACHTMVDYYEVLGVQRHASAEDIKKA